MASLSRIAVALILASQSLTSIADVIQCSSIYDYGSDEELRQHLLFTNDNGATNRLESARCFKELIDMNFFSTSMSQLDSFDSKYLPYILTSIKEGAQLVNTRLQEKLKDI
jgi:hypothetical protein